jgi:hypothetical protein
LAYVSWSTGRHHLARPAFALPLQLVDYCRQLLAVNARSREFAHDLADTLINGRAAPLEATLHATGFAWHSTRLAAFLPSVPLAQCAADCRQQHAHSEECD